MKKHKHIWKKAYIRKLIKGKEHHQWIHIKDTFVCDECNKIKVLK